MAPNLFSSLGFLAAGALAGGMVVATSVSVFGPKEKEEEARALAAKQGGPQAPGQQVRPPPTFAADPKQTFAAATAINTDLLDRGQLARAVREAGGAIEASGYPGPVSDFLSNTAYVAGYDRRLRHPSWVACHMTAESLLKVPRHDGSSPPRADRSNSVFKEDPRIAEEFRAKLADYFRSGYDRGHMVAAADAKFSQQAMDETFYLTNIAPQVGEGFNRDYWAHTEDFVRRLTSQFGDVYCFTVPLYLPKQDPDGKWRVKYEVIGNPPSIGVPTHFAKVVLGVGRPTPSASAAKALPSTSPSGGGSAVPQLTPRGLAGNLVGEKWVGLGAFVIPNARVANDTPLKAFSVPVEAVERAAGLTLFPASVKASSKQLCSLIDCSIVVRDFSDANKRLGGGPGMQRSNSAPAGLSSSPR
ncbi:unnamed protein product [Parajaminaea phylloscopi]